MPNLPELIRYVCMGKAMFPDLFPA